MENIFKEYLFTKNILVKETNEEASNQFEALISFKQLLNIEIEEGYELASLDLVRYCATNLFIPVDTSFYRNFPRSVRDLSKNQIVFDKLYNYFRTYGLGEFHNQRHSIFEGEYESLPLNEYTEPKKFIIVTEDKAMDIIHEAVDNALSFSRPLNDTLYDVVKACLAGSSNMPEHIVSKDTAIKLLEDTRDIRYARYLKLPDILKLVDYINFFRYCNKNIRKLNLRNVDRKFITNVIHAMMYKLKEDEYRKQLEECLNNRKDWNGLVHHIHFKPLYSNEKHFLEVIRSKNKNVKSKAAKQIEAIESANPALIHSSMNNSEIMRNLEYILSRCTTEEQKNRIISELNTNNGIILLQLLMNYATKSTDHDSRTFTFSKYNMLKHHTETEDETQHRRTIMSEKDIKLVQKALLILFHQHFKGKLGKKVYIDLDKNKRYALPLKQNTSNSGYGVLTTGTRIKIDTSKTYRFFTYWEKVNDIDLSCALVDKDGKIVYFFYWNTFGRSDWDNSVATFSGDMTSGYNGGSEYFDINLEKLKERFPTGEMLIFSDNVYSGLSFNQCYCKAGYMEREKPDSGEIYDPKTVKTSFTVDSESTECKLFAIDLKNDELVWLNTNIDTKNRVASENYLPYMKMCVYSKVIDLYRFMKLIGTEVSTPEEADIIVSDKTSSSLEDKTVIHPYDIEAIMKLME